MHNTTTWRSQPQTAILRYEDAVHTEIVQGTSDISAVIDEAEAVKSYQPMHRSQPQVVIGRLRNCLDYLVGQTVLNTPRTLCHALKAILRGDRWRATDDQNTHHRQNLG